MNKEPIVLGTLKKEKSSKPFFVIIVFTLILGCCFGLPYLTEYIGEDYDLDYLLGKSKSVSTTSVALKSFSCTKENNTYTYSFSSNMLIKIEHVYTYTNTLDSVIDSETLEDYTKIVNNLLANNEQAKINMLDNGFVYNITITSSNNYLSLDSNYYNLNTTYSKVKSNMMNKGYECA